jgi:hypothetical protein
MQTTRIVAPAAIAALALAAAGCGGGGGSSSTGSTQASSGGASQASSANASKAEKYSQCMRSHGVPKFPDPVNGQLTLRVTPGGGINPNSPQFKAAAQACQSLAPSGTQSAGGNNQAQSQFLKFAQCMRSHGVPKFPDPNVSGGNVRLQLPAGVDPNSPQFKAATQACQSLIPGGVGGGS